MTIGQMAAQAGISPRALRYYEEQGLILPHRSDGGYRVYDETDARRLAQVLALRSCHLPLATIRRLMQDSGTDLASTLRVHLRALESQGASLDAAIERTRAALATIERMKEQGLRDFENEYGEEARGLYGDDVIRMPTLA